jgi:8-oxo-dGTP diphosphatase
MAEPSLAEEQAWHASLPGVVVSAAALIGDGGDSILLVKPNYRNHWLLPGGICEFGEAPHVACGREVAEELGLDLPVGEMLAVDWIGAEARYGRRARPHVHFVFDGGVLPDGAAIVLQAEELDDWRFVPAGSIGEYLPARAVPRVSAAVAARQDGFARYVSAGELRGG